jgi:hypothetical protein
VLRGLPELKRRTALLSSSGRWEQCSTLSENPYRFRRIHTLVGGRDVRRDVDSDTAQCIYEDRNPVRQCTYTFHAALTQALPVRESQDLIRTVMEVLCLLDDAGTTP